MVEMRSGSVWESVSDETLPLLYTSSEDLVPLHVSDLHTEQRGCFSSQIIHLKDKSSMTYTKRRKNNCRKWNLEKLERLSAPKEEVVYVVVPGQDWY